jgi:hypothetical protein
MQLTGFTISTLALVNNQVIAVNAYAESPACSFHPAATAMRLAPRSHSRVFKAAPDVPEDYSHMH